MRTLALIASVSLALAPASDRPLDRTVDEQPIGPGLATATCSQADRLAETKNVVAFGADPSGVLDSTNAFQSALDSGGGLPAVVYVPPGTYKVFPPGPGRHALTINYDNVTLQGAGPDRSVIRVYVTGGRNPRTNWDVHQGAVWRGDGLFVTAPADGSYRSNFTLRDIRLTGQCPRSTATWPLDGSRGNPPFPARLADGDGWDLTHQGISFEHDKSHRGHRLVNVEIDGFKGELVYYGGDGMEDVVIEGARLHDSNGSIVSMTATMTLRDSEIWAGTHAIENSPFRHDNVVDRCRIHDNAKGVVFTANIPGSGAWGKTTVRDSVFRDNRQTALWVTGWVSNVDVTGNLFVDDATGVENGVIRVLSQYGGTPSKVVLVRNELQADAAAPWAAFYVNLSGSSGSALIADNRLTQTSRAEAGGRKIQHSLRYELAPGARLDVLGNDFSGATFMPHHGSGSYRSIAQSPFFRGNVMDDLNIYQGVETAGAALKYPAPLVAILGTTRDVYSAVSGVDTASARDGQVIRFVQRDPAWPVYFPAKGPGFALGTPRYLNGSMFLELRYDARARLWKETKYGQIESAPAPSALPQGLDASSFFTKTEDADTIAPVLKFYGQRVLTLAPARDRTYSTFADAPEDELLVVHATTGAVTIVASDAIHLAEGQRHSVPAGGVVLFVKPRGNKALVEVSRAK